MTGQQEPAAKRRPGPPILGFPKGGLGPALRVIFKAGNFRHLPRLLREGPRPLVNLAIQAHNSAEITRLLRGGWQFSFISSFPRSGNTWIRYLLADVFLQSRGVQTATELPVHPDKIVPDFYCNWIARRDVTIPPPAVFVKTHETFQQLQERFGGVRIRAGAAGATPFRPFAGANTSTFTALPKTPWCRFSTSTSTNDGPKQRPPPALTPFAAIISRCGAIIWTAICARRTRVSRSCLCPIELLLQYPVEILGNILRWLGARHDGTTLERAVSNMQFNKLRAMETRSRFNEEPFFFRRGCKGSGRPELQESTMNLILEKTAHLLEQANARVMAQQSLQSAPKPPENLPNSPRRRLSEPAIQAVARRAKSPKNLTGRPFSCSQPLSAKQGTPLLAFLPGINMHGPPLPENKRPPAPLPAPVRGGARRGPGVSLLQEFPAPPGSFCQ